MYVRLKLKVSCPELVLPVPWSWQLPGTLLVHFPVTGNCVCKLDTSHMVWPADAVRPNASPLRQIPTPAGRPAITWQGQQMLYSPTHHPHRAPILLQARRGGTQRSEQSADTPQHRARCAVLSLLGTYLRLCEDVPHQAISSWTTVAMLCSLLWELEFRETARRMVRQEPVCSTKQGSVSAAPCFAGPPVVSSQEGCLL